MQGDVKSKPILFNTAMVQAIRDGRKTVTRRVVKEIPNFIHYGTRIMDWGLSEVGVDEFDGEKLNFCVQTDVDDCRADIAKPKYHIGDVLWVRETWQRMKRPGENHYYIYKANNQVTDMTWRPSIHMPKEAARIFLKVTDVRVERLQDITNDQAEKEGVPTDWPMAAVFCPECKGEGVLGTHDPITLGYVEVDCYHCGDATERFKNLWDSTIKKKDITDFGWDANPWVFVYEFERCENAV